MRVNGDMPVEILMHDDVCEEANELTHWGVRGMRWGIRRYQNKDGSLTPAGKKKLRQETEKLKAEEQVLKNRKATKAKLDRLDAKRKALDEQKKELDGESSKPRWGKKTSSDKASSTKKTLDDMSDEELASAIRRAQLEQQYSALTAKPESTKKGSGFVKDFWDKSAVPALQEAGKGLIKDSLTKLGKKYLGLEAEQAEDLVSKLKKEYDTLNYQDKINSLKKKAEKERSKEAEKERSKEAEKERSKEAEKEGAKSAKEKANKDKVLVGELINNTNKSKQSTDSGKKTAYDIIDAEYENITTSTVRNYPATRTGQSYVSGFLGSSNQLALPAPRDDD